MGEYLLARARTWLPVNFPPRRWWRMRRQWRELRHIGGQQLLAAFARAHPDAFFVQIGANDGRPQDPLHFVRQNFRWRGVMVEPVPYLFERLQQNWAHVPGLRFDNVAIAEHDGQMPFWHLARAPELRNLPGWYDGLGSFSKDVVLKHVTHIPDIAERVVETQVPCVTFASLCRRHGIEAIDVLHLDTEGYDGRIVRQLDLVRHRPRLLIYEHAHLAPDERAALQRHLAAQGYEWYEEYLDTWCLDLRAPQDHRVLDTWRELRTRTAA